MKKVYVLLEWLAVDDCCVHSVYASKELLVKALFKTKNHQVYSNAMYDWSNPKRVWADGTFIDKAKHNSFESFLMENVEKIGGVYVSEVIYE